MQLKQIYFTNKVQKGEMFYLGQLKKVNYNIIEWYDIESSKIVLQSRVEDVQQSEKVRIFHHEQHQKHLKKSSILKLDTEDGLIEDHQLCSDNLVGQIEDLLPNPAVLNPLAQSTLLSEVDQVFFKADNNMLEKLPTKEEVKDVLFNYNLNAAPGSDAITSLLYHYHWDTPRGQPKNQYHGIWMQTKEAWQHPPI